MKYLLLIILVFYSPCLLAVDNQEQPKPQKDVQDEDKYGYLSPESQKAIEAIMGTFSHDLLAKLDKNKETKVYVDDYNLNLTDKDFLYSSLASLLKIDLVSEFSDSRINSSKMATDLCYKIDRTTILDKLLNTYWTYFSANLHDEKQLLQWVKDWKNSQSEPDNYYKKISLVEEYLRVLDPLCKNAEKKVASLKIAIPSVEREFKIVEKLNDFDIYASYFKRRHYFKESLSARYLALKKCLEENKYARYLEFVQHFGTNCPEYPICLEAMRASDYKEHLEAESVIIKNWDAEKAANKWESLINKLCVHWLKFWDHDIGSKFNTLAVNHLNEVLMTKFKENKFVDENKENLSETEQSISDFIFGKINYYNTTVLKQRMIFPEKESDFLINHDLKHFYFLNQSLVFHLLNGNHYQRSDGYNFASNSVQNKYILDMYVSKLSEFMTAHSTAQFTDMNAKLKVNFAAIQMQIASNQQAVTQAIQNLDNDLQEFRKKVISQNEEQIKILNNINTSVNKLQEAADKILENTKIIYDRVDQNCLQAETTNNILLEQRKQLYPDPWPGMPGEQERLNIKAVDQNILGGISGVLTTQLRKIEFVKEKYEFNGKTYQRANNNGRGYLKERIAAVQNDLNKYVAGFAFEGFVKADPDKTHVNITTLSYGKDNVTNVHYLFLSFNIQTDANIEVIIKDHLLKNIANNPHKAKFDLILHVDARIILNIDNKMIKAEGTIRTLDANLEQLVFSGDGFNLIRNHVESEINKKLKAKCQEQKQEFSDQLKVSFQTKEILEKLSALIN